MLGRLYAYSFLLAALLIDAIALTLISGIHISRLASAALLMLSISFFVEGFYMITRRGFAHFFIGAFFIALFATFLYVLRHFIGIEINLFYGAFVLIALLLSFLVIALMRSGNLLERLYIYVVLAFLTATFQFSYAFIAVYLSYKAAIDNLRDTGKRAKIKRPLTYVSGPLLLLANVSLLALEALGIYKPNRNVYLIALTVLITTLLATRKLMSSIPEGRIGRLIYLALPALIGIYSAGYTLYKLYPNFAPLDGLAKALATSAGIVAFKSKKEDFIKS